MSSGARGSRPLAKHRWHRLAGCIVAMMAVTNLQYAWTLFTTPLSHDLGKSLATIQIAFTLFVVAQTGLLPLNAYLIDRLGSRLIISLAAPLVALGWIGAGLAHSLTALYISYALGGIGVGAVYGGCIGLAMKWFPDKRGLCVGIVAGSYGFGTAFSTPFINHMISASGYRSAFLFWGPIHGLLVLIAAQFLTMPAHDWVPKGWKQAETRLRAKVQRSARDYTPVEMLRTKSFYILYVMMMIVAFSGLMVTAQLEPIARGLGFDKRAFIGGLTVLTVALQMGGALNGLTRPLFGWISDHIGRSDTMAISFVIEVIALTGLTLVGARPIWFVTFTGMTFFAWGQIYSLFPSTIADLFGARYSTTNFGIQYTSKGVASVLAGPGAALLWGLSGSWTPVLWTAVSFNAAASLVAIFWLKPAMNRHVAEDTCTAEAPQLAQLPAIQEAETAPEKTAAAASVERIAHVSDSASSL